jgi:hypothetical protein
MKWRKPAFLVTLAWLSLGYFQLISHQDWAFWLREYALILPLQLIALVYVGFYWRQRRDRES